MKEKNCYKWQSPRAFFVQRRKHHTEAMEGNKRLSDRRPTALRLVLHITKSQVGMPHMYKFLRVFFCRHCPKPSLLLLPLLLFLSLPHFPLSWTFCISTHHHSARTPPLCPSVLHVLYPGGPLGAASLPVCWTLPSQVGHKLNTERKRVGGVHAHAWLLLGSAPASPSSPLPSMSLEGG